MCCSKDARKSALGAAIWNTFATLVVWIFFVWLLIITAQDHFRHGFDGILIFLLLVSIISTIFTTILWIGWIKRSVACLKIWFCINFAIILFSIVMTILTSNWKSVWGIVFQIMSCVAVYSYYTELEQGIGTSTTVNMERMP